MIGLQDAPAGRDTTVHPFLRSPTGYPRVYPLLHHFGDQIKAFLVDQPPDHTDHGTCAFSGKPISFCKASLHCVFPVCQLSA